MLEDFTGVEIMPDSLFPASLPDFDADTITAKQFNDAMAQYSVVVLRNAVPLERVAFMRKLVVATYEEFDCFLPRFIAGEDVTGECFYTREILYAKNLLEENDKFRRYGSVPLAYVWNVAEEVIYTISSFRFMPFIGEFIKGRPMLSLNSSSIRKGDPRANVRCLFHQDGQFLGGIKNKTINTWVALDDCGVDAPGVEFVPYRVPEILESGINGVDMPWEILDDVVYGRFGGKGAGWAPAIKAGDVVTFDQMNIHRTHVTPGMTRERYALECWLFPPTLENDHRLLAAF